MTQEESVDMICQCGHPESAHKRYTEQCGSLCPCRAFVECLHDAVEVYCGRCGVLGECRECGPNTLTEHCLRCGASRGRPVGS